MGTDATRSARSFQLRRPDRHRHGRERSAPQEDRSARRHLSDRPQHQLHEFLHGVLLVLRVLPPAGLEGRLHPAARDDLPENRRNARAGRQRRAAARRLASRPANRVLRKHAALDHERFPQVHLHCFSAPEITCIAEVSGLSLRDTICAPARCRLDSIPGGGAEILDDEVRAPHFAAEMQVRRMGSGASRRRTRWACAPRPP